MEAAQAVIDATNHAATQTDRWMFVALLVIGMFSIGYLFRFFTQRIDALQNRMDVQSGDFINHLQKANKEMLEVISLAQSTISKNSLLMDRVERKLNDGRRIADP
jgi:predicted Holliday junction resolvase-like endonuclease